MPLMIAMVVRDTERSTSSSPSGSPLTCSASSVLTGLTGGAVDCAARGTEGGWKAGAVLVVFAVLPTSGLPCAAGGDPPAPGDKCGRRKIVDAISVVKYFARIRFFEQAYQTHERRFSRTAFSDNAENRIRRNRKAYAAHRIYFGTVRAAFIGFNKIF